MIAEIKYLLSIESKGIKLGLTRTRLLNDSCGNPDKNLRIIQVAGTNGKGSTSAMIANSLQKVLNKKIGLFTSPHLVNVNERIRINGTPILDAEIDQFINLYKDKIEKQSTSFFEIVFFSLRKKLIPAKIIRNTTKIIMTISVIFFPFSKARNFANWRVFLS